MYVVRERMSMGEKIKNKEFILLSFIKLSYCIYRLFYKDVYTFSIIQVIHIIIKENDFINNLCSFRKAFPLFFYVCKITEFCKIAFNSVADLEFIICSDLEQLFFQGYFIEASLPYIESVKISLELSL